MKSNENNLHLSKSTYKLGDFVDIEKHQIHTLESNYVNELKHLLDRDSVITLPSFLLETSRQQLLQEALENKSKAYYTRKSHSVYLTKVDPSLPSDHAFNRQVHSSKGCITTDQIPPLSILKKLYHDVQFQAFCAYILGIEKVYPYADPLSAINVHYYDEGQELGWHFDNSSFAITLLLQAPESGGQFEYLSSLRDSASGDNGYVRVSEVLDGTKVGDMLKIEPSTLVIFRGRDCLHRVTPVGGSRTRVLVVLAYNDQPGVCLSEEARLTFFGRTGVEDANKEE
mmetsp:Transcript_13567/g.17146  ORF Transcript_13567/g.17146 Transcript_13567/m.17146 type:complete len:284 (-) Transcript_13567:71-922(-)|eukprot:CAMPEP_0203666670 /NCGR_PEP_ID=MMETSP0090-20130426/3678_1 /ASSEMBLY_ACC=CAM_ASM_001088 /TAXON_ID=426623 /ORGANISM="Chaetoceros affinis, Strain CCMP159" /LENGTH=283 /DNA_ID=CAMNT_0050530627 /DNA_START=73 /DNA_END=924 /DNA_ORIENTATION=-